MKSGICVWVSHANVYFPKAIYEEHPSIQQYKWLISFSSSGAAGQINESQTIDKWENFNLRQWDVYSKLYSGEVTVT